MRVVENSLQNSLFFLVILKLCTYLSSSAHSSLISRRNEENSCYCVDGFACLKSGVLNMGPCKRTPDRPLGAPLALSYPHFYEADPHYLSVSLISHLSYLIMFNLWELLPSSVVKRVMALDTMFTDPRSEQLDNCSKYLLGNKVCM